MKSEWISYSRPFKLFITGNNNATECLRTCPRLEAPSLVNTVLGAQATDLGKVKFMHGFTYTKVVKHLHRLCVAKELWGAG